MNTSGVVGGCTLLASSASSSAMQSTQPRRTLRAFSGIGSLAGGAVLDVRVRCNKVVEVGDFKVHLPVVCGLAVAHVKLVLGTWPRIVRNCGHGRKVDEADNVLGVDGHVREVVFERHGADRGEEALGGEDDGCDLFVDGLVCPPYADLRRWAAGRPHPSNLSWRKGPGVSAWREHEECTFVAGSVHHALDGDWMGGR